MGHIHMGHRHIVLRMYAWPIVALCLVLTAKAQNYYEEDKRVDGNNQPFFMGSRYGRSGGANAKQTVNVSPRTDRFFMGSRYGKRAHPTNEENPTSEDFDNNVNSIQKEFSVLSQHKTDRSLITCMYTGVTNLYRCFDRKENASAERYDGEEY